MADYKLSLLEKETITGEEFMKILNRDDNLESTDIIDVEIVEDSKF